MSIWDAPSPTDSSPPAGREVPVLHGDVPTAGRAGRDRYFGTQAGSLLTAAGRGVYGGVPLGETMQKQADDLNQMYTLNPTAVERLRGATRAVFRR